MIFAEKFFRSLVSKYGKHTVFTEGGTWYDETCNIIGLKHNLHSSIEKGVMERVNQYLKDRTKVLMTTIHVPKMNVIYFMYITGYIFCIYV
jgi:hypothetical protein